MRGWIVRMQPDSLAHAISDSLAHTIAHAISDSLAHALAHTIAHAISDSLSHALAHTISDSLSDTLSHALSHTIAHTKVRRSIRCHASPMHWHALCRLHTTARAHAHA